MGSTPVIGHVIKSVGSIFGIGKAPSNQRVNDTASTQLAQDAQSAQGARQALYATEGGVLGDQLNPDEVQNRQTLLGN